MPTAGAESFFDADLAGALSNGDQHDVHQAHAADAERQQADEPEQNLDAGGDDAQIEQIGKHVEDEDGALILGIEFVVKGHRPADGVGDFQVVAFVFHGDGVQVIGVGEVAHSAVRNVQLAVHVFVAILNDVLEHADDLIGNAVEPHLFAKRVLPGEQLLLDVGAQDGDTAARVFVEVGEETAVFDLHAAHPRIVRIDSADPVTTAARPVSDGALLGGFR